MNGMIAVLFFTITGLLISPVSADEAAEMAEMQRRLNAGVMEKPFSAGDQAKVDAYIKDAMAKDLKPNTVPPGYWQPGYTCANMRRYSYRAYRDCRYHHRYYGRYW